MNIHKIQELKSACEDYIAGYTEVKDKAIIHLSQVKGMSPGKAAELIGEPGISEEIKDKLLKSIYAVLADEN